MTSKVTLISKAEYARRRGVAKSAVTKAIAEGRISEIGGKIDPVVADAQWAANTRARVGAPTPPPDPVQTPALDLVPPVELPAAAAAPADDYNSFRARREAADAELAEMKVQLERGKTIAVDAVRQVVATTFAGTRDALMQIPARLSPVLAAELDPARVHDLLVTELHAALARLSTLPFRIGGSTSEPPTG